ncbi:hypothetical protein AVEN_40012-1 [Araneus ventricosus]|uniref:Uncharacterized protein n=1 Tax=Araneus ventricosus TaxID=182803 RepID=A0A4Y2G4J3_ARAVE|nr:hypothetical protein AVEN_40012-1 [Araneus ventricosus]
MNVAACRGPCSDRRTCSVVIDWYRLFWRFICCVRASKLLDESGIESAVSVISGLMSVCGSRCGSAVTVIASDLTVSVDSLYKRNCSVTCASRFLYL